MAMGAGAFRTEAGEKTRRRAILYGSVALAFAAGLVIVLELVAGFTQLGWGRYVGTDYQIYMDAARRWLDGGSYFLPRQLGGSYDIQAGDVLYPPVALWLFVPFTMLPPVVWWITPVGITAIAVWHLRPPAWALALSVLVFVYPKNLAFVFDGNPGLYFIAALAAAVAWGSPASLALFKPSLFPLALFGITHRSWWYGLATLAIASLPVLPLTVTWLAVMQDGHGGGLAYSLIDMPVSALPLLWWVGSRQRNRQRAWSPDARAG